MTKLTREEVLKIYDRVFHYHFQQPHQINNILTVASEIQDAYKAKNADQLRDAERYQYLKSGKRCDIELMEQDEDDGEYYGVTLIKGNYIDDKIDSAMKESK